MEDIRMLLPLALYFEDFLYKKIHEENSLRPIPNQKEQRTLYEQTYLKLQEYMREELIPKILA